MNTIITDTGHGLCEDAASGLCVGTLVLSGRDPQAALFADDFESGTTGAWTTTVP